MSYLLAAEADKIQDFIFRSSRLREVVGASQLLSRFCRSDDGAVALAKHYGGDMVVNDGGSFRVIFDGDQAHENAVAFGADLSELYRLSLGGSLSVAEPVKMNGDFRAANDAAGKKLRQAKSHRRGIVAEPHMPFVAFCMSCGVSLSDQHGRLPAEPKDSRERYLCAACQIKAQERWDERLGQLQSFLIAVSGSEDQLDRFVCPEDTDRIADCDLRGQNYVAYLVADGNGMGSIFGQCDGLQQIRTLSDGLTDAARNSLAASTSSLIARLDRRNEDDREIPVLPLILGGDDLFALIPAPYALDFARSFCLAWEDKLAQLVEKSGLQIGEGENQVPRPTVAAALVICKSKYPYALAHRRAEQLLKEAKRHSKLLAAETGEYLSAVSFEVILGNRLAANKDEREERSAAIQTTLRPYWVSASELSTNAQERGIELKQLIDQRYELRNVPAKRLVELRRRFEDLSDQKIDVRNRKENLTDWTNRLERPLERSGKSTGPKLRAALQALGKPGDDGNGAHNWREVKRGDTTPLAHGMLDLLEVWDFAQDLDQDPTDYEPKEEEA